MSTADKINLTIAAFTAVSAIFAAGSVLLAIYTYSRSQERELLSKFRLTLLELQQSVTFLDNLLSEPYFAEIAHKIADRVAQLVPENASAAELTIFLKEPSHHDYIAQSIHLGRLDSQLVRASDEHIRILQRLPFQFRSQFPITFLILRSLLTYVVKVARAGQSPKIFDSTIGNSKAITQILAEALDKCPSLRIARVEMENFIAAGPTIFLKSQQRVFDQAENLMGIVAETFAAMTDSQLRKQHSQQTRLEPRARAIDLPTSAEDAFAYLELIRSTFSTETWDRIVETKTRLIEYAHRSKKD